MWSRLMEKIQKKLKRELAKELELFLKLRTSWRKPHLVKIILLQVWYGLTKQDIEDLEVLLLRKFLNTKISVPTESLYLELVCLNINTIIMALRNQHPPLLGYKEKKKKYCPKFFKLSGNTVPQEIGVNK